MTKNKTRLSAKKLLALALALIMALSALPVAFAAENDSLFPAEGITVTAPEEIVLDGSSLTGSPALTINNPTGKRMTNVQISVTGGTAVTLPATIEPGTHSYAITGSSSGKQIIYEVTYTLDNGSRAYTSYGFSLTRAATTPMYAESRQKPPIGNYTYVDVTLSVNKGVINQTQITGNGGSEPQSTADLFIDRSLGATWDALGLRFTYINQVDSKPWKNLYDIRMNQDGVASFGFGDRAPVSTTTVGIEDRWFGVKDNSKEFAQYGPNYSEWNDVYGNTPSVEEMQFQFWFQFENYRKTVPKMVINVHTVDKGALRSSIQAAALKNYQTADYTAASFDSFMAASIKANEVLSKYQSTQAEINSALAALNSAVTGLVYADADYTALNAAITSADAILNNANADDIYTISSMADLRAAYNTAAALKAETLNILRQKDIDAAAVSLSAAVAGMMKFADYSALQLAADAFHKLNAAYYDKADIDALADEVDKIAAEIVSRERLADTAKNRADIAARADALLDRIANLEMLPADYTAYQQAVQAVEDILFTVQYDRYTTDSITALENAYLADNVKDGWKIDRQAEINAVARALNDAIDDLIVKPADKADLLDMIRACETIQAQTDYADYTQPSRDALAAAIAHAYDIYNDNSLTIDDQAIIENEIIALQAARRGLTLKPADYTALDDAIAAREAEVAAAKEAGIYTEASITRVEIAIDLAKQTDRTLSIKEQTKVNDAVTTLNSVKLEKQPADYSALKAAIEVAQNTLNAAGDEYTDASKAALGAAIKTAQAVVAAKYDITQQQLVDDAVTALESVKLVLRGADYSKLDDAIHAAEEFLADPETEKLYTEEAIQAVKDALADAKAILPDLDIHHQNEINAAADAILDAIQQAQGSYNPADLAGLIKAVEAAAAKLAAEDIKDYTDASVAALTEARDDAQAMIDRKPAINEQDAVNAKAAALNAMTLTLKGASYDALDAAIVKAELRYSDAVALNQYTPESLAQLKAAIDYAKNLSRSLTIRQQNLVDEAEAALNVTLVYKGADMTALNAAISAAEAKLNAANIGNYTEGSVKALEAALKAARDLRDQNPDILQQAAVNAEADRLNAVQLVLKGADYSALDAIINAATDRLNAPDINTFTPASVDALKAALAAAKEIDRGLDINYQPEINEAVANVQSAIDGLTPYQALSSVSITSGGQVLDGQVLYVKVPWTKTYKSQSVVVGFQTNAGAEVKSISWSYANWSVDKPEANIETPNAETTVIRPNGKGIGARSCWITVTVEDHYGNKVTSSPIKVRFYNWNWQIK